MCGSGDPAGLISSSGWHWRCSSCVRRVGSSGGPVLSRTPPPWPRRDYGRRSKGGGTTNIDMGAGGAGSRPLRGHGAPLQAAPGRCSPSPSRGPALPGLGCGLGGMDGAPAPYRRFPAQGAGAQADRLAGSRRSRCRWRRPGARSLPRWTFPHRSLHGLPPAEPRNGLHGPARLDALQGGVRGAGGVGARGRACRVPSTRLAGRRPPSLGRRGTAHRRRVPLLGVGQQSHPAPRR